MEQHGYSEEELARQRTYQQRLKDLDAARAKAYRNVTLERALWEIEQQLAASGRDPGERETWNQQVLLQVRLSTHDLREETSPDVQLKTIAEYCAEHELDPVALCFEIASSFDTEDFDRQTQRSFRPKLAEFEQKIRSGELDADAVVAYHLDRFSRDNELTARWLKLLRSRGMDFHEADKLSGPRPLGETYDELMNASVAANKASRDHSRRQNGRLRRKLERGESPSGHKNAFGHRPLTVERLRDGTLRDVIVGQTVVPGEAELIRAAARRLLAGDRMHHIVEDWKVAGVSTRNGFRFTDQSLGVVLRSPRICGYSRFTEARLDPRRAPRINPDAVEVPIPEPLPPLGLNLPPISSDGLSPAQRKAYETTLGLTQVLLIQPIISFDEWAHLQVRLAPNPRRRYRRHAFTGLLTCGTCGANLRGQTSGEYGQYACSKPHLKHLPRSGTSRVARDGLVHPAVDVRSVERFVTEAALAALDQARLRLGDPHERLRAEKAVELEQSELERLTAKRRRIDRAVLAPESTISEAEFDEAIQKIGEERAQVEERLRQARELARLSTAPPAVTDLRAEIRSGGPRVARQIAEQIIDHVTLYPKRTHGDFELSAEISWRDNYEPEPEQWRAFCEEMLALRRSESKTSRRENPTATPASVRARIMELHDAGLGPTAIARQLDSEGVEPVNGGPWNVPFIRALLITEHQARGEEYDPPARASRYSQKTRDLVFEVCRNRKSGETYAELADSLNRAAAILPSSARAENPGDWTEKALQRVYASECARRGQRTGRRPALGADHESLLRVLHAQGRNSRQIADVLNGQASHRLDGKPWNHKDIWAQLKRLDLLPAKPSSDSEGQQPQD